MPQRLARHVLALPLAVLFLLPLLFMFTGSLRRAGEPPPTAPELVPSPVTLENYPDAYELVDLPRYLINSLLVAAILVPLSVLFGSWAGFAMAQLSRRPRALLVGVSLVALMVPVAPLIVPRFALFRMLDLTNTYVPLIAPALIATSPLYVLLFYWSFRRVPRELIDAARIEGLSPPAIWRRVALPMAKPVTYAVAVLAFLYTWSDFLGPLVFLYDEDLFTLPLGLRALAQVDRQNLPLLLAGAVTATVPVVAAFLLVQRFFLQERKGAAWLGN